MPVFSARLGRARHANLLACALLAALPLAGTAAHAAASRAQPSSTGPSNEVCNTRANTTLPMLLECIQEPPLWQHLVDLQAIADANKDAHGHGNRNTGTKGYLDSVNYVARLMTKAGYSVTIQPYPWRAQLAESSSTLRSAGTTLVMGRDFEPARQTGAGQFAAPLALVQGQHGCAASDWAGFPAGAIALLPAGGCTPDAKRARAEAAHARALLIAASATTTPALRGQRSDGAPVALHLTTPASIPVLSIRADLAARWTRDPSLAALALDLRTQKISGTDYNLIADSPQGDPTHVVVVEGHLDGIYGAGMLDNGSGSATILEIALKLAHTPTTNQLRFIWFGGEELGLLGSAYYTQHLTGAEIANIAFDIDVDVTATPNFDVLVADPGHAPNKGSFPANVIPQSQPGNAAFLSAFSGAGIAARLASFGNDGTDSNSFSLVGVPNTGVLTNQDCCKSAREVAIWGGYPGDYEGVVPGRGQACVDQPRRWCDNLGNNDPFVLEFVSKATANVVFTIANSTTLPARR